VRLFSKTAGGMGVAVSTPGYANAIAKLNTRAKPNDSLGTVSLTGVWVWMARLLQDGDADGKVRRALAAFPNQEISRRIIARYYRAEGRAPNQPYVAVPILTFDLNPRLRDMMVATSFAAVWLAREGHNEPIAVNLLEKIQLAIMPCLYGAMLAGAQYYLIGAGNPIQIAEVLDRFASYRDASYRVTVGGMGTQEVRFDPTELRIDTRPTVEPLWFPIVSSHTLAEALVKKSRGPVHGFIVEHYTAAGHNAPPRGRGGEITKEVIYNPDKDTADLSKIAQLGRPYILAGSQAEPDSLQKALALGAAGIQIGSIGALARESGWITSLKLAIIQAYDEGRLIVRPDGRISPSGYPFQVVQLPGTAGDPNKSERPRRCDIGALAVPRLDPNGTMVMACPSEPVDDYIRKGGQIEATVGRGCVCNDLLSAAGRPQTRVLPNGTQFVERPLATFSQQEPHYLKVLPRGPDGLYGVADAFAYPG